ncbi:Sel1 repeat family [Verrucomicrobiia bacterium DG1235]|nr:Sel1 repeat family [Verrucomicrobiae bacterium DG1235]
MIKWNSYVIVLLSLGLALVASGQEAFDDEAFEQSEEVRNEQLEEAFVAAMAILEDGKYSSVVRSLKGLAADGHAKSQYVLGEFYRSGAGVRLNLKKANHWLKISSEQGYPIAMLAYGENAFFGKGMPQSYKLARRWLEPLSERNWVFDLPVQDFGIERQARARASYLLGMMYAEGYSVVKDNAKSIELMIQSSNGGDVLATLYLSIEYARGEMVERDIERSKRYFEMVDLQAFDSVRRSFQSILLEGVDDVIKKDIEDIADSLSETFTESIFKSQIILAKDSMDVDSEFFDPRLAESLLTIASSSNYKEAQYLLGYLYAAGLLGEPDYEKALPWMEKAAEKGWSMARYNFAVMLANGLGIEVDNARSRKLLDEAAASGMYYAQLVLDGDEGARFVSDREDLERAKELEKTDVRAAYAMTRRREKGWLVSRESNLAKLSKAYLRQAKLKYVRSQHMYGKFNYSGKGVEIDYKEALRFLSLSANRGYSDSYFYLGYMYSEGLGVGMDSDKGFYWYDRAVEAGDASASTYNNLGVVYEYGNGRPKDLVKACEMYEKAAELDSKKGLFNLAVLREKGLGSKKNMEEAVRLYSKSADLGYLKAAKRLMELYRWNSQWRDVDEMVYWLERSAELGEHSAMLEMSERYFKGIDVPKSQAKALGWASQYMQNETYLIHYGVRLLVSDIFLDEDWAGHDPEQAYDVVQYLMKLGNDEARFRFAEIHRRKLIKKAKPSIAFKEYKKLYKDGVEKGWPVEKLAKAAFMLSRMYAEGEGVKHSVAKRVSWMKVAADAGLIKAKYLYAGYQMAGVGMEPDIVAGINGLEHLAIKGYAPAIVKMGELVAKGIVEREGQDTLIESLRELANGGNERAAKAVRALGIELEGDREKVPSQEEEPQGFRVPAVLG